MAAPGLIGHDTEETPAVQANQRRNLLGALALISRHLDEHPTLTANKVLITNLSPSPPPPFPTAAGAHFPPWRGFDAAVRCATVLDVADWCGSTNAPSCLSLCVTATRAELKVAARIGAGAFTVTAAADWLAAMLGVSPGEKRQLNLRGLTMPLEAHARQVAEAAAS
jgi:hypothetical protein